MEYWNINKKGVFKVARQRMPAANKKGKSEIKITEVYTDFFEEHSKTKK